MSRLAVVLLCCAAGTACMQKPKPLVKHRAQLPFTDLGWVKMHDHFVATVGPSAGRGAPLGDLLVLADATFAPQSQFPLHRHERMEILSVVVKGTLTHHEPDTKLTVPEGAVQRMWAGPGIVHAEGNETGTPVRMLQIWLTPKDPSGPAEHHVVAPKALGARLTAMTPSISLAKLEAGQSLALAPEAGHALYVVCLGGDATISGERLGDGDGALIEQPSTLDATTALEVAAVRVTR